MSARPPFIEWLEMLRIPELAAHGWVITCRAKALDDARWQLLYEHRNQGVLVIVMLSLAMRPDHRSNAKSLDAFKRLRNKIERRRHAKLQRDLKGLVKA